MCVCVTLFLNLLILIVVVLECWGAGELGCWSMENRQWKSVGLKECRIGRKSVRLEYYEMRETVSDK